MLVYSKPVFQIEHWLPSNQSEQRISVGLAVGIFRALHCYVMLAKSRLTEMVIWHLEALYKVCYIHQIAHFHTRVEVRRTIFTRMVQPWQQSLLQRADWRCRLMEQNWSKGDLCHMRNQLSERRVEMILIQVQRSKMGQVFPRVRLIMVYNENMLWNAFQLSIGWIRKNS